MNEIILLGFIKFLILALVVYWVAIGISLVYRARRNSRLHKIEVTFADLVSRYLFNSVDAPLSIREINASLRQVGIKPGNPNNIQYLIRLLIRTQQSIIGSKNEKLNKLYAQIPPYGESVSKVNSWGWYRKARGIREIYEMNQHQYFDRIFKYRNHRNVYVRREAQIAMVVFRGWESLRFLSYLKRNMTLWQQIKIVEKLYDNYPKPELKWLRKAYKSERSFAKCLLMRIIRKFELHSEIDFILKHLFHPDYNLRETAIYCLGTFAVSSEHMDFIKKNYSKLPNSSQQALLLDYISENSELDVDFYLEQLYGPNEDLILNVAEILWNNGHKEKVQEFYLQQYPKATLNVG